MAEEMSDYELDLYTMSMALYEDVFPALMPDQRAIVWSLFEFKHQMDMLRLAIEHAADILSDAIKTKG